MEQVTQFLENIYLFIDDLKLSIPVLVGLFFLGLLALTLSFRELTSWYFKINDIRSDLSRLEEILIHLESEMRTIQNKLNENSLSQPEALNEIKQKTEKPSDFQILN